MNALPNRRALGAAALALGLAASLVACGSDGDADSPTTTAPPASADPGAEDAIAAALETGGDLTIWAWAPQTEAAVAAFEDAYPNVTVNLVNNGSGNDQYTAVQNAIDAGSGAPDLAQIEYQAIPQFVLRDALVDLNTLGADSIKGEFTDSSWEGVSVDGGVYGLPQDAGPMAMYYREDIFAEHDIDVPTTWDEYVEAARALNAADPNVFITNDNGDAGFATSLIWQAGGTPFINDGENITIDLQDEGTKKWTSVWNQLLDEGLLDDSGAWSDEWNRGLQEGTIATLVFGAWMPANIEGIAPETAGLWRAAPMPQYAEGENFSAAHGGSAVSVLEASANKELAYGFLRFLNAEEGAQIFYDEGSFPAQTAILESDSFLSETNAFFGDQEVNKVLADASNAVRPGWSYLAYQVYANSVFNDHLGPIYEGRGDINEGLVSWQEDLVTFGNEQGFSVNQ